MKRIAAVLLISCSLVLPVRGQEIPGEDELPPGFEDPFSVEDELPPGFEDPFAIGDDEEAPDSLEDPFAADDGERDEAIGSFDYLFETDEMIEEIDEGEAEQNPEEQFLTSEILSWGGVFDGAFESSWNMGDPAAEDFSLIDPETSSLTAGAEATLFFDARPDPDFRVFGKFKIAGGSDTDTLDSLAAIASGADIESNLPEGWSTAEDEDGNTVIYDSGGSEVMTVETDDGDIGGDGDDEPETGTAQSLELSVFELFSDFTYKDRLFVRFGKHTIQWGTGYFWSPADVLNLTAIDAEDPTADIEGPVSLKIHVPFSIHNAYLYLIANDGIEPSEVAVAPKVEFVVGGTELSLAGYYQAALSPRAIAMATGSLGDVGLFGEAVLSYGSDRTFIRRSKDQSAAEEDTEDGLDVVLDTFTVDDRLFFSATCGFNWYHSFDEPKLGSIMVIGQYYFNGEGYDDSSLLPAAYRLFLNSGENGLIIDDTDAQPEGYEDPPALSYSDLANFGRHYGALVFTWSSLLDEDITFSTLALANLSDLSFIVSPNITFTILEHVDITAGIRWSFGSEGGEFTNPEALISGDETGGGTVAFTISGNIGGGSF